MKAESIEQIRNIHGRILSATESIEDTVDTDLVSEWRRNQIISMCKHIDECVRQLEEAMKDESN
jgi:tetrahydromethanopterin S-methyltransferase subunit B